MPAKGAKSKATKKLSKPAESNKEQTIKPEATSESPNTAAGSQVEAVGRTIKAEDDIPNAEVAASELHQTGQDAPEVEAEGTESHTMQVDSKNSEFHVPADDRTQSNPFAQI